MSRATPPRSVRAIAHAVGTRKEMQPIVAAHRQVSEVPILLLARPRKQPARMMQTVRHGHAEARSRPFPMDKARAHPRRVPRRHANPRDLRRQAITATGQVLPTAVALTVRRSVPTETRPATAMAAIRNNAPTIPLLPALIRISEPIPRRAAAIQLRLAPTPHPAAVIAAEEAAAIVAVGGGGYRWGGGGGRETAGVGRLAEVAGVRSGS